jgi:glycosyltransferase involved in cell wall biosynthesis
MIQSRIALADVLVLPSRWDGWGMVVNEALTAGVPVIVSDRCGAADLIQHGVNGFVFRSEDVDGLRQCLRKFLDNVDKRPAMRSAAAITGRAVSAEAAAPYLIECLKHMAGESHTRPAPPWLPVPASQSARN